MQVCFGELNFHNNIDLIFSGVWIPLSIWSDSANSNALDRILENRSQSASHLLLFANSGLKVIN